MNGALEQSAAHAVDNVIGTRIRQMRRESGLSLEQVADHAGLSIGFLSQVERGLSSPTLRVLSSVADALGVAMAAFFPPSDGSQNDGEVVVRSKVRPNIQLWRSGIRKQLLTPAVEGSRINVTIVELDPGASTGEELYAHNGEEAGVVLSGAMRLTVEDETWTLNEGDSFRFKSSREHRFSNAHDGLTRVIWVNATV